jgi:hypothetical protein
MNAMKKIIKNISVWVMIAGIMFTSCNDDFLDLKPSSEVPSEDTWKDPALSEAFVTGVYAGLGNGGFDEQMLACLTDEAVFTHAGRGINTVTEGTLNPSTIGWTNNTYEWNNMYANIRAANVALTNLATATFDDQVLNDRLRGEAHFLRGYYYQQLLRYYGGVPLIEKLYGLGEPDYTAPRNTYEECVTFILKECDSAVLLLNGKTLDKGRATKVAAMALKARVLLYAASDLHDIPTAKAKSTVIASFDNPELLGYISGDRTARWKAAKDAAKAVIDLLGGANGGYKMNLSVPASFDEAKANYISMAMAGGSSDTGVDASAANELIFARYYNPNNADDDNYIPVRLGLANGPNGYHCWAGNTPIQQLVDDYVMMDGSTFDWNDPAEKAEPYQNREPRFYASILYDAADWKPRDLISGNVDPANQIQTGEYKMGSNIIFGLDTRHSSIEDWNGCWTGYYMRKFIDPNPAVVDNNTRQFIPWPFFRFTEEVFNYIEACIELHEDAEAAIWLNRIRFRVGLPAVTATGDALKEIYRRERRIEMAYEEQRYHDARRWMIAQTTLGRKIKYINVQGVLKSGATAPVPYKHDENAFTYTYTPVENNSLENRQWLDKMYFLPISRDEINKNDKLIQNPGYE